MTTEKLKDEGSQEEILSGIKQPRAEGQTSLLKIAETAETEQTTECPVCLSELGSPSGDADVACPECGAGLRPQDGTWVVLGPLGSPLGVAEDYYRHECMPCTRCAHHKPAWEYVALYFFAWAVIVTAVYLGGVNAGWLGGFWTALGLALYPAAYKIAKVAGHFTLAFFPEDLWRCRSAGAATAAGTNRPEKINLNGKCRYYSSCQQIPE